MSLQNVAKIIAAAAYLARVRRLIVKEKKRDFSMRPVMHVILRAKPGCNKSTTLGEIGDFFGIPVYTSISRAALIGSIENGQATTPAAWEVRNNLFLLDEYEVDGTSSSMGALNQLMESPQTYIRKIARKCPKVSKKEGDLYFKVHEGTIEFKTRFSAIIMTMKNPRKNRAETTLAFLSRCIYVFFNLTQEDFDRIADGDKLFELDWSKLLNSGKRGKKKFNMIDEIVVKNEDYEKIRAYVKTAPDYEPEKNPLRMIGDCVRFFVANGCVHEPQMYDFIVKCHIEAFDLVKDVLEN
jgi:hypothetical protein